ncbi:MULTISPECIES: DinB family protein [Actinomadura]|uniref:DinB family protein n=1 Tax=Actinomadura yumaensis TaxID=111807 RepID=A0ABW2CB40_9ACTN|nr:DinB family protein [Actinomadura sp. J1-007]MWK34051.1 DUF664 domain-containing protein [Actinomadura sp. J1-007]
MPGNVRPVADERDGLLSFLAQQRHVVRVAAHGLTDDQARSPASVSALTVGGIIKHLGRVEEVWCSLVDTGEYINTPERLQEGHVLREDETLQGALDAYARAAERTDEVVAEVSDLGRPVPIPRGVPWFPQDEEAWSVRWVLLHLIQETARHAGHADIIRESIDGASAFPLMAAVEGWPETSWMKPWTPKA